MNDGVLRLHHFLPRSCANGPGVRAVLWVQGCSLACPGCFNPDTHALTGGERVPVTDIFQRLIALSASIEGLTISGGEPLQQRRSLLALLQRVRQETPLSVVLFTGYTWEEVQRMPDVEELLSVRRHTYCRALRRLSAPRPRPAGVSQPIRLCICSPTATRWLMCRPYHLLK